MSTKPKRERRIVAGELAELHRLAKPVDAAYEKVQDAQLVANTAKAAYEPLAVKYARYGAFLAKRYRLKAEEEIDPMTGVIQKRTAAR